MGGQQLAVQYKKTCYLHCLNRANKTWTYDQSRITIDKESWSYFDLFCQPWANKAIAKTITHLEVAVKGGRDGFVDEKMWFLVK